MSAKNFAFKEIQKKIELYCVYQERSHKEVIKKLNEMGIYGDVLDKFLVGLIQNNFLNEARFANSYARGKFKIKFWGKKRITYGLKKHDVSDYNIKNSLKEISDNDYEKTLENLTKKILKSCNNISLSKKKEKVFSALKYRGWELELIYNQIRKIEK